MNIDRKNIVLKEEFKNIIDNISYDCIYEIFYDFFYNIGYRIKFYYKNDIISILFMTYKKFIISYNCERGTVSEDNEDDFLYNLSVMMDCNHHVTNMQKSIGKWVLDKKHTNIFDKQFAKMCVIKKCGM